MSLPSALTFRDEPLKGTRATSRTGRPSKSDLKYWEGAVFKRKRQRAGGPVQSSNWRIQLQRDGRRVEFDLATPNRSAAARFARELSDHLRVNGWEATLARYKPAHRHPESGIKTVGEFSPRFMLPSPRADRWSVTRAPFARSWQRACSALKRKGRNTITAPADATRG
jgi:hypothetical protein